MVSGTGSRVVGGRLGVAGGRYWAGPKTVEGGSLVLLDELELRDKPRERVRERGRREDLLEEFEPLADEAVEDRDREDREVLEGLRWREIRGRIGREDSFVLEVEEVQAGVSGGSSAGLLPLRSILRSQNAQEKSAESREGRTYRFESQSTRRPVD